MNRFLNWPLIFLFTKTKKNCGGGGTATQRFFFGDLHDQKLFDQVTFTADVDQHLDFSQKSGSITKSMDVSSKRVGCTPQPPEFLYLGLVILTQLPALSIPAPEDLNRGNCRGDTPLFVAAQRSHLEVVRCLLDAGADDTLPNKDGQVPWVHENSC